ncbi:MAG: hypothetical protein COT24_01995 [Candidatus Kerfeldbacteria bacterium CG08_land_8_20_14_0_20_40_16]|uniref:Uncharacterized protein n=1 Tax=Candidatus Kerfeldbacteria bacterium CG08_land_8_20_14_0_20_40_16 TaxID=2014244 RepID=A0A2H0YW81_9BACT|nr:MAG: hypothetical protein COT24_01995 [Candidatus Kerfeldbacteria bacterium CG08_land_8_20_14_0_20_40_16]
MKAMLFTLVLIACVAFLASAGVIVEKDIFHWQNPGGNPLSLPFVEAIQNCPEIPKGLKEQIVASYPDSFHVKFVNKGEELEDWMYFGKGKVKYNVRNTWEGMLYQEGKSLRPVPKIGMVWEKSFLADETVTQDSVTITTQTTWLRIRVWQWCHNISGTTFLESKRRLIYKQKLPSPPSLPPLSPPEPEKESRFSIHWITEFSHWNNFRDPLVRYNEGKIGLRFRWLNTDWLNLNLETDCWLLSRVHTANNGDAHPYQLPLFQVNPKLSLSPTNWSFLMLGDAFTFSSRGKDTNTALALGQIHLAFMDADWFEPMIQLGGSVTDSWPRYLSHGEKYPESRAQYREIDTRLQLVRIKSLRIGWEAKWFDFAKTRVDSNLTLTSELAYLADGRPSYGGPFVQLKLPWDFYVDASVMRQHIDAETYVVTDQEARWVPGSEDEWRVNIVLSRGFRLDLFK